MSLARFARARRGRREEAAICPVFWKKKQDKLQRFRSMSKSNRPLNDLAAEPRVSVISVRKDCRLFTALQNIYERSKI